MVFEVLFFKVIKRGGFAEMVVIKIE